MYQRSPHSGLGVPRGSPIVNNAIAQLHGTQNSYPHQQPGHITTEDLHALQHGSRGPIPDPSALVPGQKQQHQHIGSSPSHTNPHQFPRTVTIRFYRNLRRPSGRGQMRTPRVHRTSSRIRNKTTPKVTTAPLPPPPSIAIQVRLLLPCCFLHPLPKLRQDLLPTSSENGAMFRHSQGC